MTDRVRYFQSGGVHVQVRPLSSLSNRERLEVMKRYPRRALSDQLWLAEAMWADAAHEPIGESVLVARDREIAERVQEFVQEVHDGLPSFLFPRPFFRTGFGRVLVRERSPAALAELGGLSGKAPRAKYGSRRKWHDLPGGRVSYGRISQREFEVTLEFETGHGGVAHTKRYAQTFRRDRGFFDVRLYDPHPSGGGWSENYYERSTRATNHEQAVKKVATARFARTERHIVVAEVRPLDQRPSGVGGLGHGPPPRGYESEKPKLHTHVETKWQRGGEKHCVVHFSFPGGTHREPVGPISAYADEREIIRRALVTARPRIEQKVRG